ncbi:MAG TPA: GNAT family N-acetyltransferase [Micromonosporaceae bacterium]
MVTDPEIRPAQPADVPEIVGMVHALAAYERAPEQCHLTPDQLHAALFCEHPALFGHVVSGRLNGADPGPLGFALWFRNYSTWEGVHGIYLEDLYVKPEARRAGLGRRLLAALAATCLEQGYHRLEWSVLHWNPAREFYHRLGAVALREWLPYRFDGDALRQLAKGV